MHQFLALIAGLGNVLPTKLPAALASHELELVCHGVPMLLHA